MRAQKRFTECESLLKSTLARAIDQYGHQHIIPAEVELELVHLYSAMKRVRHWRSGDLLRAHATLRQPDDLVTVARHCGEVFVLFLGDSDWRQQSLLQVMTNNGISHDEIYVPSSSSDDDSDDEHESSTGEKSPVATVAEQPNTHSLLPAPDGTAVQPAAATASSLSASLRRMVSMIQEE
jgi:hypothetical protein